MSYIASTPTLIYATHSLDFFFAPITAGIFICSYSLNIDSSENLSSYNISFYNYASAISTVIYSDLANKRVIAMQVNEQWLVWAELDQSNMTLNRITWYSKSVSEISGNSYDYLLLTDLLLNDGFYFQIYNGRAIVGVPNRVVSVNISNPNDLITLDTDDTMVTYVQLFL